MRSKEEKNHGAVVSIDLGTTNTVVAVVRDGDIQVMDIPDIARPRDPEMQGYSYPTPLVPSAVFLQEYQERFLFFFRRRRQLVLIGQQALDQNIEGDARGFAGEFKPLLGTSDRRPILQGKTNSFDARQVTQFFLERLMRSLAPLMEGRAEDLIIPTPVGYYEPYRAELQEIASGLGVKRFRSVDEPIAAALGLGIDITKPQTLLVCDFGGGTVHVAIVRTGAQSGESGQAKVLAKSMLRVGGRDVDLYVARRFCPDALVNMSEFEWSLKREGERVKEEASRGGAPRFTSGNRVSDPFTREDLIELLEENGFYKVIRETVQGALAELEQSTSMTVEEKEINEAVLTGGSSLLPGVPEVVMDIVGRDKVRELLPTESPFEVVARGACVFASGAPMVDFIYHDYALGVYNEHTREVEYELLVPRRTRYPTAQDFATRYYADYNGMAEMNFRVSEVGRNRMKPMDWCTRENGASYWVPAVADDKSLVADDRSLVVDLNPGDPAIRLSPAGVGTSPRLRVDYSVNADRWICMTVQDLVRKTFLRRNLPVVRLR
ncbi:MAG: Hsp70 family protein [Armatimonadetes bacterium]|nr:Hsp70 family protein [Armatimonadota bacterium]